LPRRALDVESDTAAIVASTGSAVGCARALGEPVEARYKSAVRDEADFFAEVDHRFPFDDEARALALLDEGCAFGPNAAFMVAYIVAVSAPPTPAVELRLRLLAELGRRFVHLLAADVLDAAMRRVRGEFLTVREATTLMERIAPHHDQYNALAIADAACEDHEGDALDALYDRIVADWRRGDEP